MRRNQVAVALGVQPTAYATQSLNFLDIEEYWDLRLYVHYDGFGLCEFIELSIGANPTFLGTAMLGMRLRQIRHLLEPADPELDLSDGIRSMKFGVSFFFSHRDAEGTCESVGAFSRGYAKNYVLRSRYWEGYDIVPRVGVGGIRLGMTKEQMVDELCERPLPFPSYAQQHLLQWLADLGIHPSFDSEGRCTSVDVTGAIVPRLQGHVLLGCPYRQVLEFIGSLDPYISIEDNGFASSDLGIGIRAPVSAEGLSALVSGVSVFAPHQPSDR
jgi:hypothetical protein